MRREEVEELMHRIGAIFPRFSATPERVDAWHEILRLHDYAHARTAVRLWCSNEAKAPVPANVLEGIRSAAATDIEYRRGRTDGPVCRRCGNTGFVEVNVAGRGTVKRCTGQDCTPPLPSDSDARRLVHADEKPSDHGAAHVATLRETLAAVKVPGGRARSRA